MDRRRGDRGTADRPRSDEIGSSSPKSDADEERRRRGGGAGTGARLSLSSTSSRRTVRRAAASCRGTDDALESERAPAVPSFLAAR